MKREKFYSFIYGLVLIGVLAASSVSGQIAFSDITPKSDKDYYTTTVTKVNAYVDTEAITTISDAIKQSLQNLKGDGIQLEAGTWNADVAVNAQGQITNVEVTGSRRTDFHRILNDIILNVKTVKPIAYNGVAKDKVIRIPVILVQK